MASELSSNTIAWEEGEPAQTLLAPEQPINSVVSSFQGQVFFLTEDGRVYLSTLKQESTGLSGKLQELALPCQFVVSIACNLTHILFVTDRGRVLRSKLATPEKVEEFRVNPHLSCSHGVSEEGARLLIREVSSRYQNVLLVSDSGKIWIVDEKQSGHPQTIPAFDNKAPMSIISGNNFSVVLIQEYLNSPSAKRTVHKPVFLTTCPDCRNQALKSKDAENHQPKEESEDDHTDSNTLAQVCWSKADHLVRQSALLLNSEAAKQFLTRQLSWVTGSSDLDENQEETAIKDKDNVTSRMAEGVRNIGQRLSRHWSSGSQEEKENLETLSLPLTENLTVTPRLLRQVFERRQRWKRQESSSSLSLDSVPQSDSKSINPVREIPLKKIDPDKIVFAGQCLLNTSVWTWGQGSLGQLGQSDCVSRDQPTCIRSLNAIGICKLVTGSFHCLALSLDGRLFAWGSNSKGQIGPDLSFISSPQEITLPFRTSIKDIAAGGEHSLLLATTGQVFFLGLSMVTQKSALMRLNLPVHSPHNSWRTQRIWASGSLSCCFSSASESENSDCTDLWTELLISEQLFLRQCLNVYHSIVEVLLPSGSHCTSSTSSVRQTLFSRYKDLVSAVAYNVHTLLNVPPSGWDVSIVRWCDEYIQLYGSYTEALNNALVVNALHLSKSELLQLDKLGTPFQRVMIEPIERLREYSFHLDQLAAVLVERKDFSRAARSYKDAACAMEIEYQKADLTRHFWDSCSTKIIDALRTPERRLIRESRSHPITLLKSGRFSSHWFIILTDVLVHVGYSTHVTYPLNTIWVEPLQDCEANQSKNCLVVTMPEECLTLSGPTGKDKVEWLTTLQSAINTSLKQHPAASNSTPTRSTPPLARYASYVFTKSTTLKDVFYQGYWFCGKMQGEGELRWPDGRVYKGNFRQNLQFGYGISETPGPNGSYYEGSWKDGKMCGYGTLRYANGDVYEGYFQDNQPHGHGTLKRGHFLTSAAHVYVGQWESGQKHGYGVMDDIVAGEKYMGMWQEDAKHGSAVLVTLDGLYIEGCFTNNKMTGQCVMLLEDGTSYEGEVAGIGILGGKGLMRLPNGDVIQGTFHGSWSDGIKVNATFTKASLTSNVAVEKSPSNQAITNQYYVPAQRKWEAIFRQCSQNLGLTLDNALWSREDMLRAWEHIAVVVSQMKSPGKSSSARTHKVHRGRKGSSASSKSDLKMEQRLFAESCEVLQCIPDYGREQLDPDQLKKIEIYLQTAMDSSVHPLGRMIGQLVDVYRSTYVGVGAHPRLLPHAVAEIYSFVKRIYAYVALLFPALPTEDRPIYFNPNGVVTDDSNNATVVSASSLLLPLLLPRVYPPLFTLYALHNEKHDDLYWDRLQKWNKQSDLALMNFLAVDSKFYQEEISGCHFSG